MAGRQESLARRLNHLFSTVHKPDCREYSNDEVATAITRDIGVTISASYIWYLRTGQRNNPTFRHLNALASFFGVPAAYFFDDETAERVDAELGVAAAMRDSGVRTIALRATGLSAESLATIRNMIDRVRQLEGLPPPGGSVTEGCAAGPRPARPDVGCASTARQLDVPPPSASVDR